MDPLTTKPGLGLNTSEEKKCVLLGRDEHVGN